MNKYIFLALPFLFLIVIRFLNLQTFPIFGDEALYLYLADTIAKTGQGLLNCLPFGVFPIFIWILSLLLKLNLLNINPLLHGRISTVTLDCFSALFLFLAVRKIVNFKIAIFASLVYLILPINFFHSRLVLLESSTNFFIALSLYLVTFKNRLFWITSGALALSFFSKPLGLLSIPAILSLPLVFNFRKNLLKVILLSVLTIGVIGAFYLPVRTEFNRYLTTSNQNILIEFKSNLFKTRIWLEIYYTLPVLLISVLILIIGFIKKQRLVFWLGFWIVFSIIAGCIMAENYYPRHLYLLTLPISILVGLFFNKLFSLNKIFCLFIFILIFYPATSLNLSIIKNPFSAAIVMEDKQQYLEDWSAGTSDNLLVDKLNDLSQDGPIIVFVEDDPSQFWALQNVFPLSNNVKLLQSHNLTLNQYVESNLLMNTTPPKYLILNRYQQAPMEWPVQLVESFSKGPNRVISIYSINLLK